MPEVWQRHDRTLESTNSHSLTRTISASIETGLVVGDNRPQ
jgi:hypothetical protein